MKRDYFDQQHRYQVSFSIPYPGLENRYDRYPTVAFAVNFFECIFHEKKMGKKLLIQYVLFLLFISTQNTKFLRIHDRLIQLFEVVLYFLYAILERHLLFAEFSLSLRIKR